MLELIYQSVIFGLFIGALYALAAVGFSYIYGVMRILNIAHGELVMIGGYACFVISTYFGLDPFIALPLVIIVMFLVGVIIYMVLFARIIRLEEKLRSHTSLLVSFGLILIISQLAVLGFTADERSLTAAMAGDGVIIGGIKIPYLRILVSLVSAILILGLQLFLKYTLTGKTVRAAAENWESALYMGININRVYLSSFAVACALAGAAGSMIVVSYSINPSMGLGWMLKVFVVAILAGVGSIAGTIVAGIMLGVVESVASIFIGPYREVVGLVIFLLVLLLRPQGLFGKSNQRV